MIRQKFPKIKLYNEKNQGVSYARNKGIIKAQNKWLAFLDSDDQWLPNKIKLQVEKINNYQNKPLLVHTNELWIKDGNILNQKKNMRR